MVHCVFWSWPCVCLSLAAFPYCRTDLDVTWGNGRECTLVVRYWVDLQSVRGFRCYDSIVPNTKCQRVLVVALCLVDNVLLAGRWMYIRSVSTVVVVLVIAACWCINVACWYVSRPVPHCCECEGMKPWRLPCISVCVCLRRRKKCGKVKTDYKRDYFHSNIDVDFEVAGPVVHGAWVIG